MKTIVLTVTNDLSYDQRMIRICSSLSTAGYDVLFVGRKLRGSVSLQKTVYRQKRLACIFNKGVLFYAEFNIRLFIFILYKKVHAVCAIDLDTIVACWLASVFKNVPRIYDAHELFCEMKEIVSRPFIYRFWKIIERWMVPQFKNGYTVNEPIRDAFQNMYRVNYEVIRNLPLLTPLLPVERDHKVILYQGAVNEGRSFETLIPAMSYVDASLCICGDGNFMDKAKKLVEENHLQHKIIFKGKLLPAELRKLTATAYIGVTLFDKEGLSNYYSLANRFFDYMHAGMPQLCVDFPVYRGIVSEFPFAVLVDDISTENLAREINLLLNDEVLYGSLRQNCLIAREQLNWNLEEKKLLSFYKNIITPVG